MRDIKKRNKNGFYLIQLKFQKQQQYSAQLILNI